MTKELPGKVWNIVRPLFRHKWVYHTLFWVVVLMFYSLLEMFLNHTGFLYTVSNNLVRLLILGAAVYYNIYVLIPKYLARKKFMGYMGLLLLVVFVISPIESLLIFVKSNHIPEMQASIVGHLDWSFVSNFFMVGTSSVVKITVDWYKNLREKQEIQTETIQSELRFLKSQINPHFLFNTLNSLYALTLKKSDKAPDIVLKLSEMMRYMLYECNEPQVLLSKEVNYISNYLDLELLRQGNNMNISFTIDGTISDQQIAPLMFIPFIENCFKHGLGHHLTKGFVTIRLAVTDHEVELYIENSKSDNMPKQRHARSGGIGLVNVRRRLDLLYPGKYTLSIHDNPQTYIVNLKLLLDP
ncbi:MAG: sensor histidine kinase [Saprospiraceae bacterium]